MCLNGTGRDGVAGPGHAHEGQGGEGHAGHPLAAGRCPSQALLFFWDIFLTRRAAFPARCNRRARQTDKNHVSKLRALKFASLRRRAARGGVLPEEGELHRTQTGGGEAQVQTHPAQGLPTEPLFLPAPLSAFA